MPKFEINSEDFDNLLENNNSESSTISDQPDNETSYVNISDNSTEEISDDINNDDFINVFLNQYGLKNGMITYENEDGTTEEVSFNSLDNNEKLNILKELASPNLTEDEINTINYLRSNNATIQDVIDYYSNKAVQDYINQNGKISKKYKVDDYTDDEIYIADLKSKYNMTEEDIKAELELAKENESLFNKKVNAIRERYKQQEEKEAQDKLKSDEEKFTNFKNSIENGLNEFNAISMDYKNKESDYLQIENSEKENIYKYILDQDENGMTQFFKDLNDPKKMIELAWFSLYGKDAISNITNYWKKQDNKNQSKTTFVPKNNQTTSNQKTNQKYYNGVETPYGENLL